MQTDLEKARIKLAESLNREQLDIVFTYISELEKERSIKKIIKQ